MEIFPAQHFIEIIEHLKNKKSIPAFHAEAPNTHTQHRLDLSDILGQTQAKRALTIAASGAHSILFIGPPGTGKTMLASRLPSILPSMTEEEALQAAALASISLKGFQYERWQQRPFRSPHHSASGVALVGGGSPPRPGEISLAHQGVLFLDELPEFSRHVLEALREPLESGHITISRAARQAEFPANFQLVAAMNPCPCGYLGDTQKVCRCTPEQISRYHHKISGPILDRIDMHVQVPRLPADLFNTDEKNSSTNSDTIREHVEYTRQIQINRAQKPNAQLSNKELEQTCQLEKTERTLLTEAMKKLNLSARAYHRTLKLARTIADISKYEQIKSDHIAEALSYRCLAL